MSVFYKMYSSGTPDGCVLQNVLQSNSGTPDGCVLPNTQQRNS